MLYVYSTEEKSCDCLLTYKLPRRTGIYGNSLGKKDQIIFCQKDNLQYILISLGEHILVCGLFEDAARVLCKKKVTNDKIFMDDSNELWLYK